MCMKKSIICNNCGKEILKYPSLINKTNNFCNRTCHGEYQKTSFKGNNNPNYNKKWSEDQKIKQSDLVKSKVNDEYRFKAGSANRNKKFSEDRIKRMHGHRTPESYSIPHTEQSKKLIGIKSKEKFTVEYLERIRKTNEKLGHWVPLEDKDDYNFYSVLSNWKRGQSMFNLIETREEYVLFRNLGVFNSTHNKKGVVRDHRYSRKSGFINKVHPEILRHPCNCKIITHAENVSKSSNKNKNDNSITLDDLFENIINYKGKWPDQEIVLNAIKEYKSGLRYDKSEYRQKYYKLGGYRW